MGHAPSPRGGMCRSEAPALHVLDAPHCASLAQRNLVLRPLENALHPCPKAARRATLASPSLLASCPPTRLIRCPLRPHLNPLFHRQMKHEGASALFKGIVPQIGSQLVATGMLFGIQDIFRTSLAASTGASRDDLRVIATAGFAAGGTLAVVTCPMELIKVNQQACKAEALCATKAAAARPGRAAIPALASVCRSLGTVQRIVAQHGVAALYTGVSMTSLRCAVGNFAYFGAFEAFHRSDSSPPKERSAVKNGIYGAISGMAYWLVCYPLDLVKSKQQAALNPAIRLPGEVVHPLPWRYIAQREVARTIGCRVRGLYKGIGVTLVRGVPVSAVGWMVYGLCQQTLG